MVGAHDRTQHTVHRGPLNGCLPMVKAGLILLGSVSVALGVIGIFVPGLPTTPFLLIAAACYVRSSERLYHWLLNHKVLGKFVRDYQRDKAMPLRSKIVALASMWSMIGVSVVLFIQSDAIRFVVVICGLIGTAAILSIKTVKEKNSG